MMNRTPIQLLDDLRESISEQMQRYEDEHGQVETLPIYVGERPAPVFRINVPGKPKGATSVRRLDHERAEKDVARKTKAKYRVEKIREMAGSGATIEHMAKVVSITPKSVMRIMRENNIPRGPKMILD